MSQLSKH